MNPIHHQYAKNTPHNDYADLFRVTDALEPKKRDEAMMVVFMDFVKIDLAPERHPAETYGERMLDYTNYNRFKRECLALPENLAQSFVVAAVVHRTLSYLLGRAEMDKAAVVALHQGALARAENAAREGTDERTIEGDRRVIQMIKDKISGLDKEVEEAKELYAYMCDHLALPLMNLWAEKKASFGGEGSPEST